MNSKTEKARRNAHSIDQLMKKVKKTLTEIDQNLYLMTHQLCDKSVDPVTRVSITESPEVLVIKMMMKAADSYKGLKSRFTE